MKDKPIKGKLNGKPPFKQRPQDAFQPRYPGDGYNHEVFTATPGKQGFDCPCGTRWEFSQVGNIEEQAKVVVCKCDDWHVVFFRQVYQRPFAKLIFCGKE